VAGDGTVREHSAKRVTTLGELRFRKRRGVSGMPGAKRKFVEEFVDSFPELVSHTEHS
jgi:hypothetical protein